MSSSFRAFASMGTWYHAATTQSEYKGTYRIATVCFDGASNVIEPSGACVDYDTGSPFPAFAIIKPAVDNTRVDMSPYWMKWYGKGEKTARERAEASGAESSNGSCNLCLLRKCTTMIAYANSSFGG